MNPVIARNSVADRNFSVVGIKGEDGGAGGAQHMLGAQYQGFFFVDFFHKIARNPVYAREHFVAAPADAGKEGKSQQT